MTGIMHHMLFSGGGKNTSPILTGVSASAQVGSVSTIVDPAYAGKFDTPAYAPRGVYLDSTGTRMFVGNGSVSPQRIFQYTLGTAWDVTTATFVRQSVGLNSSAIRDIFFRDDGTRMFVLTSASDRVEIYTLSSAWDVSTASYVAYIQTPDTSSYGLWFRSNGTKVYSLGDAQNRINEQSIAAWGGTSPSGQVTPSSSTFISYEPPLVFGNVPYSIAFNSTGTKLYMIASTQLIYEFDCATAYSIATATYNKVYLDTNPYANTALALFIGNNDQDIYTCWGTLNSGTAGIVQFKA